MLVVPATHDRGLAVECNERFAHEAGDPYDRAVADAYDRAVAHGRDVTTCLGVKLPISVALSCTVNG
eukprot:2212261-Prymnesium_polylepis.2